MNEEKSKVIDTLAEYSIIFFIVGAIAIGIFSTIFFTNYDLALITNLFYNGLIFYSCLSGIIIGIVNFIVAYLFIKKRKFIVSEKFIIIIVPPRKYFLFEWKNITRLDVTYWRRVGHYNKGYSFGFHFILNEERKTVVLSNSSFHYPKIFEIIEILKNFSDKLNKNFNINFNLETARERVKKKKIY